MIFRIGDHPQTILKLPSPNLQPKRLAFAVRVFDEKYKPQDMGEMKPPNYKLGLRSTWI